MKWNFKPWTFTKQVAAGLSIVTMCSTQLAQGAQAKEANKERTKLSQKELISQYLRTTGLTTKKLTAGEYWKMVRPVYPAAFQKYMDAWIVPNRNMPMPTIDATTLKGRDGEQVRLLFSDKNGQSMAATFTGDISQLVKINGVSVTNKELMNTKNFPALLEKLAKSDASMKKMIQVKAPKRTLGKNYIASVQEFKSFTARQKAEYFIRLRLLAEAGQKLYKAHYGVQAWEQMQNKHEYALRLLLGTEADAAARTPGTAAGQPCIVAGYLSVYGENSSCGGNTTGWTDVQNKMQAMKATCSGGGIACNPMVYGFSEGGGAHCMTRSAAKFATRECNKMSPLQNADKHQEALNKKRIVETYMKQVKGQDIDLQLDQNDHISLEQYEQVKDFFTDLKGYVDSAVGACGQAPLQQTAEARQDQASACQEIKDRAFALEAFPVAPQPDLGGKNCDEEMQGSVSQGNQCLCPEGTQPEDRDGRQVCAAFEDVVEGPVKEEKEKKKGGSILPILGILAVVGVGAWLIFRDKGGKDKPPVYVPPAPVSPVPTTSTTPVDPPPSPCPEPNTVVNGVCTPPVVVPPDDTEGGTKTPITDAGGGVR
jgi:hypothetical protein